MPRAAGCGGAVIRRLLQTRKTLHHKGVWLLLSWPRSTVDGSSALHGFSSPLTLDGDWRRGGISGPRLPVVGQQRELPAVISWEPAMVADDDGNFVTKR